MQKKSETHLLMDCPKLNIFRHSSMYLWERESNAFLKSMSRMRDSIFFLLVNFIKFKMLMMILRLNMLRNCSDQLINKLHAETAEALNILPKDTSGEEVVLLGIETVLVVIKEDIAAMFARITSFQNIEVQMLSLLVN